MTSNFQTKCQPVTSPYSPSHVTLYANGRKPNQKLDSKKQLRRVLELKGFSFFIRCLFAHNFLSCELSPALKYLNDVISFSQKDKRT